ncbi:hypothetical protein QBC43DRAFT_284848 [Cladorrhinum sp. PSN259]|nr:hypothetical protein QBC43DRAFT_284848 [Cladorrhinum sp. PSN259]
MKFANGVSRIKARTQSLSLLTYAAKITRYLNDVPKPVPTSHPTSRKRGNLAAGWFADFLREKGGSEIESFALLDGDSG